MKKRSERAMRMAPYLALTALLAALLGCDSSADIPLPAAEFSAAEVVSIDVIQSGESTTFFRNEARQWFRHSEGHQHTHFSGAVATTHRHTQTDPVDNQLVAGAVGRLAALRTGGVAEDGAVSLDKPSMTIVLRGQDDGAPLLTLQLAPSRTPTGAYYAQTGTNEQIFVLSRQEIAPILELLSHTQSAAHQH